MKAPLLIVATILGLLIAAVACGDGDEELAPAVTATLAPSGSAPPVSTPAPSPPTATPLPVPSDWKQYTDAISGISFPYPPDLVAVDLTGPNPHGEFGERDIDIRSEDKSRAIVVSIFESDPNAWSLDRFANEFYCARDSRDGSLGEARAIFCTREVLGDQPEACVVTQYSGRFIAITGSPKVSSDEFSAIVQGFTLPAQ